MNRTQLGLLFCSMLFNYIVALGLLPFLPLHATTNLGVDPGQTGIFLSVVSMALTAGTLGGGWLSDRFHRHKLIILASGLIGFPSLFSIAYATNLFQLTLFTALAWLAVGMSTTMVRIMTGILADESQRGRIFGIIGVAVPLSSLIGGMISGPIVDRWDIATLFMIMSSAFVLQIIAALFITDAVSTDDDSETTTESSSKNTSFGRSFWLLNIAILIMYIAIASILTARPLHMDQLGFDGTAISQIVIPGAILSLPLTFYIGSLSDQLGRKRMFVVCYVIVIIGMAILIISQPLWHFWVSEICMAFVGVSSAVAAALVTDLVPRKALDTALSYMTGIGWIGTIIGFAISGYIVDAVGVNMTFAVATTIAGIALLITLPIQNSEATTQNPSPSL